jgi:pimeloyl-ACP methyl ester carboxylesterase
MKYLSKILPVSIILVLAMSLSPKKDYDITPADFGVKYKDMSIDTKDGHKLKAWYFTPSKKSGTLIIISHDGQGNMSSMIEYASNFVSLGYNVLTYDYRGFGGSSDFKINPKFVVYPQFAQDLNAVITYMQKRAGITQVFLFGKGMGGALSICAAAGRRDVQKAIADSPWDELNNYQKTLKELKSEDVMIPLAYERADLDPQFALTGKYAKVSRYLLINGADDQVFTGKMMKKLAKLNPNVDMHTVKKATAETTFSQDKTAYFEAIKEFIK